MIEHLEQVEMQRHDGSRYWSGPLTRLQVRPYIANRRALGDGLSDVECHPECPVCYPAEPAPPAPILCVNCDQPIEPDTDGRTIYHVETSEVSCDPEGEEQRDRYAEPPTRTAYVVEEVGATFAFWSKEQAEACLVEEAWGGADHLYITSVEAPATLTDETLSDWCASNAPSRRPEE